MLKAQRDMHLAAIVLSTYIAGESTSDATIEHPQLDGYKIEIKMRTYFDLELPDDE